MGQFDLRRDKIEDIQAGFWLNQFLFFQFQALGATQRESIMTALNEDAEKLIAEYEAEGARDEARRLQEEIRQCNKHYHELLAKCRDQGKSL